jgi:hypothetical protein
LQKSKKKKKKLRRSANFALSQKKEKKKKKSKKKNHRQLQTMDDFSPFHQGSAAPVASLAASASAMAAGLQPRRQALSSPAAATGDESAAAPEAKRRKKEQEAADVFAATTTTTEASEASATVTSVSVRSSVRTKMWAAGEDEWRDCPDLWPEVQQGLVPRTGSVAVAFAGGGTRAMAAGMGEFRALGALGWTDKIDMSSSSSGGTWCNTIYSYYSAGASCDAELLGPLTEPAALTPEALADLPECRLAYGTTVEFEDNFVRLKKEVPLLDLWVASVSATYLERFGIRTGCQMTLDAATWRAIVADNPALRGAPAPAVLHVPTDADPRRPFPVFNQTFIGPIPQSLLNKEWEVFIWNSTPLYAGVPYQHKTSYRALGGLINDSQWIGGNLIEPFAVDGGAPYFPPPPSSWVAPAVMASAADKPTAADAACEIIVETGDAWFAGSGARVMAVLHGERGDSKEVELDRAHAQINGGGGSGTALFVRGETSVFAFDVASGLDFATLGPVHAVSLRHDGSGWGAGWFLARLAVRFPSATEGVTGGGNASPPFYEFACHTWLTEADKAYSFGGNFVIELSTADIAFAGSSAPVTARLSVAARRSAGVDGSGDGSGDDDVPTLLSETVALDSAHALAGAGKLKRGSLAVFAFTAAELFPNMPAADLARCCAGGGATVQLELDNGAKFGQVSGWFLRCAHVTHGGVSTAFPANAWIDRNVAAVLLPYSAARATGVASTTAVATTAEIATHMKSNRALQVLSSTVPYSAAESAALSGGFGGLWSWFPPPDLRGWITGNGSDGGGTGDDDDTQQPEQAVSDKDNKDDADAVASSSSSIDRSTANLGAEFVGIVDSGFLDNSGILSCLMRRQDRILYFNNTETPLNLEYDPSKPPVVEYDSKSFAASVLDCTMFLPPLFGFIKKGDVAEHNQVFPKEDWEPLILALQDKIRRGEPVVHVARHRVLENKRFRIQGGWECTVVWMYLQSGPQMAFERQLPKETQDMLALGRPWPKTKVPVPPTPENPFPYFPNFITESGVYKGKPARFTPEMASLLAAYTEWTVRQSKDIIEEALFK